MTTGEPRVSRLGEVSVLLILIPALVRAMSMVSPLPWWDLDPLILPSPAVGLTPALAFAADAVVLLGCGLGLIATRRLRAGRAWWTVVMLALLGCGGVAYHGWISGMNTLGHQRIGAAWGAALLGGVVLWRLCGVPRLRVIAVATLLALAAPLLVKGLSQVTVEHAQTLAEFRANKEATLAAMGWSPDSTMAKGYERRISQVEATGWFGLSNVYASFAAGMLAGFVGLWWAGRRAGQISGDGAPTGSRSIMLPALMAVGCAGAVAMAGSKGGVAAACAGAVALWLTMRRERMGGGGWLGRCAGAVPIAMCGVALLVVVVRGALGERSGELSILFRWFYMQAAVRIMGSQPVFGTGPDGFRDAYLLTKNPLSPEEVSSPHSVLFDWGACLGLFGVAWGLGLVIWLAAVGRGTNSRGDCGPTEPVSGRLAALGPLAASVIALALQQADLSPTEALVRVLALAAFCALAAGLSRLAGGMPPSLLRVGPVACAAAIAAHAQIEMSATWEQSCGIFFALLGAASPGGPAASHAAQERGPSRGRRGLTLGFLCVAGALALGWFGVRPAWRWETTLHQSAEILAPVSELRERLDRLALPGARATREEATSIARALSEALGRPVEATPDDVSRGFQEFAAMRLSWAAQTLAGTLDARNGAEWRVERESARLLGQAALLWPESGAADRLTTRLRALRERSPTPWESSLAAAYAGVLESSARATMARSESASIGLAEQALERLEIAMRLSPFDGGLALRRYMLLRDFALPRAAQGDEGVSGHERRKLLLSAAEKALELDALLRLDPLRRMDEKSRARVERTVRELRPSEGNPP
ncbi:MAG: O-antigen ligase family protein [Phycisphaerales bacterium]